MSIPLRFLTVASTQVSAIGTWSCSSAVDDQINSQSDADKSMNYLQNALGFSGNSSLRDNRSHDRPTDSESNLAEDAHAVISGNTDRSLMSGERCGCI